MNSWVSMFYLLNILMLSSIKTGLSFLSFLFSSMLEDNQCHVRGKVIMVMVCLLYCWILWGFVSRGRVTCDLWNWVLTKSASFDLCRNMRVNSEGCIVWNNQDIPSNSRKYHWAGEEFICIWSLHSNCESFRKVLDYLHIRPLDDWEVAWPDHGT